MHIFQSSNSFEKNMPECEINKNFYKFAAMYLPGSNDEVTGTESKPERKQK